jgi:hypothetical protein
MRKLTPGPGRYNDLGPASSEKTAETMRGVIAENYQSPAVEQVQCIVEMIQAKSGWDIPQCLQWVASKLAYYEPDTMHQTVRTPARLLKDKRANCVDYTVLICCVAKRMGLNAAFELAGYSGPDFQHVYPVINGVVVDVVPDQMQDGSEFFVRRSNFLPKLGALKRHKAVPIRTKLYQV